MSILELDTNHEMFVTNTPLAQILTRQGRWPMSEQDKNWTHQRFQGGWGGPRGLLGWEGGRSMEGGLWGCSGEGGCKGGAMEVW